MYRLRKILLSVVFAITAAFITATVRRSWANQKASSAIAENTGASILSKFRPNKPWSKKTGGFGIATLKPPPPNTTVSNWKHESTAVQKVTTSSGQSHLSQKIAEKGKKFERIFGTKAPSTRTRIPADIVDETKNRFAYVFYITTDIYACYALANADRLINKLNVNSSIDIVLVVMEGVPLEQFCLRKCFGSQLKIKRVPPPPLITDNKRYQHCYVRFEAFKLTEYDRVIILDADGVVIRNLDHLFTMDLEGRRVAAAYTPNTDRWLDSVLTVAIPSLELYEEFAPFLSKENITKVARFANGAHFDMDLMNLVFERGNGTKLLSKWYAMHDHQFVGQKSNGGDIGLTYYLHYTADKPFEFWETRKWHGTDGYLSSFSAGYLYKLLWSEYDKHCSHLAKRRFVTLPVFEKEHGFYYPDPNAMADYLQKTSDYLVLPNKTNTENVISDYD